MPETKPKPIKHLVTKYALRCASGHTLLMGLLSTSAIPSVCLSCNKPFILKEVIDDFSKY
jgi:hypothetical protein